MFLRSRHLLVFLCALSIVLSGRAQQPATRALPPYTPLVYDADWSALRDPALRVDWTDRLHYVPLGVSGRSFLSVSGQVRERGEHQDYPAFGAQPPDNGYLLQRYLLGADLHLNTRVRFFLQLDSGWIEGRDGGPRPGIDRDRFDINQGFVEFTPWRRAETANVMVRTGRQLVSLGSTRLVATGAGLNVEQPFDGARVTFHVRGWTADGLALRPTLVSTGSFDNQPNSAEELWGLYTSHPLQMLRTNVDLYYLGFGHRQARYVAGSGREQRETVGVRVWQRRPLWDYDFEYTNQFGRFGPGDIRAWAFGYHGGYTLVHARLLPIRRWTVGFSAATISPGTGDSARSTRCSRTATT